MSRFINPIPQYILANGDVAAGGSLAFYESGTNTLITLYADVNENIPIANPVTLGSRGEVPNIFFSASARCVLTDANGYQIYDVDPVNSDQAQGAFEIWNSNLVYGQSDIVFGGNGEAYISLVNENQGNDPTLDAGENAFWARVLLPQVYNSQVSYQPNEFAIEDGVIYRSLISNNTGNQPSLDNGTQWKSIANGIYVDYDNTSSGLVAVTAQAALDEIVNLINNLPSSVIYRGQLDVSAGDSALPATPQNGDLYVIAVAGTITVSTAGGAPNPVAVNVGEQIIYNGDTGNWDLIAQVTQASSVSYNNTASGLNATDVQTAIDEVESRVDATENATTANASDIDALEGRASSLEAFEAQAGTAYTADVQTNQLDTSAGALMAVGAFGLGSLASQPTWPQTSLNNVTGVGAGVYRATGVTTERPTNQNGVLFFSVMASGSVEYTQVYLPADSGETGSMYIRSSSGGTAANPTWSPWREVWHDGNLVKTTSATDSTEGRVPVIRNSGGIFGLGSVQTPNISNADTIANTGFYATSGTFTGSPFAGASSLNQGYIIHQEYSVTNYAAQFFISIRGDANRALRYRVLDNGTWSPWSELWTTSNLVKTTSPYDATDGRIPVIRNNDGIFGLGASGFSERTFDFNTIDRVKFGRADNDAANKPPAAASYNFINLCSSAATNTQIAMPWNATESRMFIRSESSSFAPWAEVWTDQNLVKTTSPTDATAGRILQVGDFGLGGNSQDISVAQSVNGINDGGLYRVRGDDPNRPASSGYLFHNNRIDNAQAGQLVIDDSGEVFFRVRAGSGVWQPWSKLWHDGNLPLTVDSANNVTFPKDVIFSAQGIEGGQVIFQKGSGSTLDGDAIIDQQANNLRFFENGGSARGARIRLDRQGANASSVIYTSGDPNVNVTNTSGNITHNVVSPFDVLNHFGLGGAAITLSNTGVSARQVVKIIKVYQSGVLNINADSIVYPDNSSDTQATIKDGVAATATFIRNNSNTAWVVSIKG